MAVIGAGLAGLRCADVLLARGFSVTIIEARDRVGGRLHQQRLANGHLVDVGPNWIHGTSDNPMLDLARSADTPVGSWDATSYVFDDAGTLLPLDEGERLSTAMWDIIQDAFRHSNALSADIDSRESLADFFAASIADKIPDTEADAARKRHTLGHMSEMWGAFVGSPVTRQSLKFFWLEECIEGGAWPAARLGRPLPCRARALTLARGREPVLRRHVQKGARHRGRARPRRRRRAAGRQGGADMAPLRRPG